MNRDLNKGLDWIQYNSLNLPAKLQFVNGNKSEYLYDASGVKHRAKYSYSVAGIQMPIDNNYTENNSIKSTTVTDYCGNYIYDYSNDNLRILNPEGYYDYSSGYVYLLKDHLGSTAVVLNFAPNSSQAQVLQTTHYYASGLEMYIPNGTVSGTNPYLYNGKEMNRMHGLNMVDYGARWYDPTIMRWGVVDPLAEKSRRWSPYVYGKDNPIRFIDPDGMQDHDKVKDPVQIPTLNQIGHNFLASLGLDVQTPKEKTEQEVKETIKHNKKQAEIRKVIKETAKAEVRNGADKLEKTGTVLQATGYVAAPLTRGASITLVPVGKAIESVGSLVNSTIDFSEGQYGKVVANGVSTFAFGQVGKKVKNMENAGELSKESTDILQLVIDAYDKMSSAIINAVSGK